MSRIMDIYLIRHGLSTGNGRQCFMGWSDHPLTDAGRAQAVAAARRLAPLGPMPVLCSDLLRARQTAEIIAGGWQGEVLPDRRWRETDCGDFEDRPWDDFSNDAELQAQFDADAYNAVMPGGESAAMMAARVTAAFAEVLERADERLVIVSHAGPICAILAHCLAIPPTHIWRLYTDHGSLTHLACQEDWISIRTVNDTSHLPGV
jgi:probable phosphoglycerate mutase